MSKQSRKGSIWEVACERYLKVRLDDEEDTIHIERLHGTKDQGDIHGLSAHGKKGIVECKNHAEYRLSDWVQEAEAEACNADAEWGVVFIKRKGRGLTDIGQHWALMSIDAFCEIIDAAPSDLASMWGGTKSAVRRKVEMYAKDTGKPVDEVLLTLLHEALRELEGWS